MKIFSIFISLSLILNSNSFARSDSHAPIGVARDHIHKKGEIMASYRYAYMKMKGLRQGDDKIATGQALDQYAMAPNNMYTQAHMFGVMYGLTDKVTISSMLAYITKDMDINRHNNSQIKQDSQGISDLKLNASYQFKENWLLNLGTTIPFGAIDADHQNQNLPYAMQIGSGSYQFNPGISYSKLLNNYSFGGQINGNFYLNQNSNNYKLGDNFNITTWLAKPIKENLSISTRLNYHKTDAIEGFDDTLSTNMTPSNGPSLYGKQTLEIGLGANTKINNNLRFGIEGFLSIYQNIDGPMLENDFKIVAGFQKLF